MRNATITIALGLAFLAAPASADAGNAVTRSVEQSLDAVRAQNVGTPNAGRLYAMVTVAMYDAVNGIDRAHRRGRTHALVAPDGAPVNGNRDAAAAAAADAVLRGVLRADQPPVSDGTLEAALAAEIAAAGGRDDAGVAAGADWGEHVGKQVLAQRSADGTQSAQTIGMCSRFSDPLVCEPGEFHAGFDARWRNMKPFGIADASAYGSPPPPALDGSAYAVAYDDVRTCGSNSAALDALCADPTTPAERGEISMFWLAEGGTVRETGTFVQASLAIVEQQGTVESTSKTARLFALVGMAIADAVKVSWEAKATYFTWRPTTAIRRAGEDGNAATAPDGSWTSRITPAGGSPTIGSSPEYNSGTSTFAGAASAAIEGFYCRPVGFSFQTDMAPHGPRSYANPLEAAREAGRSRIFQGIHFQFSNEDGRRAGRGIGSEIARTKLLPVNGPRGGSCG
jgi:hypothetical protein